MSDQKLLDELIKTLNLEKLEENLFRGQSEQTAWGRVFGGQVIGQALSATQETVDNSRKAHSLHAYFLRPGRIDMPILYCLLYTSPSPRDSGKSRMPSSA